MNKQPEKTHDELMRDAQYRKSRSIAFFNATNSAITIVTALNVSPDQIKEQLAMWREWFLSEYDKDYKENVMSIGLPQEIISGLDTAKKAYESGK